MLIHSRLKQDQGHLHMLIRQKLMVLFFDMTLYTSLTIIHGGNTMRKALFLLWGDMERYDYWASPDKPSFWQLCTRLLLKHVCRLFPFFLSILFCFILLLLLWLLNIWSDSLPLTRQRVMYRFFLKAYLNRDSPDRWPHSKTYCIYAVYWKTFFFILFFFMGTPVAQSGEHVPLIVNPCHSGQVQVRPGLSAHTISF